MFEPIEDGIAAVYSRVSTFKQAEKGISLDEQERKLLEYAKSNGLRVPDQYRFREAASGLKDEREEYDKIRRLVRERKIAALVVYSSDRHTRDPIHGKIFRAELRRAKTKLHVVTEGGAVDIYSAQGELMATVKDAFNRYWLDKILEVTYEKKQEYIRRGIPFVQGNVRYGYRRVGKQLEARAEVDEAVAPVIRRIYNWADEGLSVYAIERLLRGIPAPGELKNDKTRRRPPGRWSAMTVYRILRDEIYAGVYWANREITFEDENGKKRKEERPREEWVSVPVPAIVSREQWERVQKKLDVARTERQPMHAKYQYLLARRVACQCGYKATTYPRRSEVDGHLLLFYKCSSQTSKQLVGPPCDLKLFRAPESDEAVWQFFCRVVEQPEMLLLPLQDHQRQAADLAAADDEELAGLDALIAEQTAELNVVVSEYTKQKARHGPLAEAFRQQLERLEETITALTSRRERLARKAAQKTLSAEEIETITGLLQRIRPVVSAASFERRRSVLEAIGWTFVLRHRDDKHIVGVLWRGLEFELEVPHPPRGGRRKTGK